MMMPGIRQHCSAGVHQRQRLPRELAKASGAKI